MVADPLGLGVRAAGHAIRTGTLSAVDLTQAYLRRAADTEPGINAYVTLDERGALAAADRADRALARGVDRGALHGIPVGVKDLIDTRGIRTTYGSGRYRDHVPQQDAEIVSRLREAGAVILGKHATHEFAWGGRTDSPHFGPTRNPHDGARVPGGSSGGGAASIAAGSCLLSVGTDTAGSIRIPASFCGCVGFKPTRSWAPLEGIHPLAPSLDHIGVLGRDVSDVAVAFGALGGVTGDVRGGSVNGLRIGVLGGRSLTGARPEVRRVLDGAVQALSAAGASIEPVVLDLVDVRVDAILTLVRAEAEAIHRAAFREHPGSFGSDLAELLALGPVSGAALAQADRVARAASAELVDALDGHDVVLGLTVPVTAPAIGELVQEFDDVAVPIELILTRLTSVADAAGVPAISIPATAPGLPVGLQLMAPRGADAALLASASAVEVAISPPGHPPVK
ncbi:MAG: amidase [Aeromicrobium sp.]